jgi:AraC-like DNA-binding protein
MRYDLAMPDASPETRQNTRRSLVASKTLVAEEIVARPELPPSGETTRRQLVITYSGAFEFQVGRSLSWVDPTRLLFAEADVDFVDHHVVPGVGHRSLILSPDASALDELSGNSGAAFSDRLRACSLNVQMFAQRLRRSTDDLASEELGLAILVAGLGEKRRVSIHDPGCVRKAKALLHDSNEPRRTLTDIASEVGVTPIHLTQAFKRSEGVPLYRYQTQLRMGRALAELPERDDITDLALDLGYSSHSHFTAAFRSAFGVTPSAYRADACS